MTCYTYRMPKLSASLNAMRAISVVTVQRLVKPILLMTVIVFVALYCLMIFLALSFSGWWWLLLLLLLPLTLIALAIGFLTLFLLKTLLPRRLSQEEQIKLDGFAEKLLGVLERSRFSYPVIVFLIAKDIIRKKESSFLRDMIGDSKDLTREYGQICRMFEK